MQLSKFTSPNLDIIALYRSQRGKFCNLNENLSKMIREGQQTLIIGDINFCYLDQPYNTTRKYLENQNYSQLIHEPTHIEGHILDQAYIRGNTEAIAITHSKYYTDHKGLAILIRKGIYIEFSKLFLKNCFSDRGSTARTRRAHKMNR